MSSRVAPRTVTHGLAEKRAATLPGALGLFSEFAVPRIFLASLLVWAPIRFALGPPTWTDLAIVAGVALYWPLQEWFLHMNVLHIKPRQLGRFRFDPWFARVHRWHHRHPDVLERVFLPTSLILLLTPIHWALWHLILPPPQAATGVICMTFAAGIYEWVHYLVHTPYKPQSTWFGTVRRNHMLHHFKSEHYWHAFTVPLVDTLFGTNPDPASIDRSPTCRTLGVDDSDG